MPDGFWRAFFFTDHPVVSALWGPIIGPIAAILGAEGQARAIDQVFQAVHRNDPDPKLLAYQYLQTLPQLVQGPGTTFFVIPSEVTSALSGISKAFTEALPKSPATQDIAPADELTGHAADDAAEADGIHQISPNRA